MRSGGSGTAGESAEPERPGPVAASGAAGGRPERERGRPPAEAEAGPQASGMPVLRVTGPSCSGLPVPVLPGVWRVGSCRSVVPDDVAEDPGGGGEADAYST